MNERITDYALPSHHSREKGTELALAEVDITQDMVPIQAHMSMGEGNRSYLNGSNVENDTAYVCKRWDLCRFDEIIRRKNENK